MGLFNRFRVSQALRMQRRKAARANDAETVELITRALDSNLILDEIDCYATEYEAEFGTDDPEGLTLKSKGGLLGGLIAFLVEHWEEILKIILSLLAVMDDGKAATPMRDVSEGNRILAEDAHLRKRFCFDED